MSLINQVLSDLEKRGANAVPAGASIRVVPMQSNRLKVALLTAALLALVFLAANLWLDSSQPEMSAPARALQPPVPNPVVVPQPQPVAAIAQEAPQEKNRQEEGTQETATEIAGPASRLSLELSSIPLPSTLRTRMPATTTEPRPGSGKAAPPAARAAHETGTSTMRNTPKAAENKAPAPVSPASVPAPALSPTPAAPASGVDKQTSVKQQADNEFRKANGLMQQGRIDEALAGYEAVLRLDAGHDETRLALAGLLLKNKRNADAERVLQDGLNRNPKHSGFAMLLARLQVERNALPLAMDTLQKTLPYASQQADYQAFIAAVLQRQNRHAEAISRYQVVLQLAPNSGVWLMGLGISLQAVQRNDEARTAFKRAIESGNLSTELQDFVNQRLKEL